jgi:methyl halide transferase
METPESNVVQATSFWNERYICRNMPWDLGQPAPPLVSWAEQHTALLQQLQTVAVVGAGAGHDAAFFASVVLPVKGTRLHVTGMDLAPEAVNIAKTTYEKDFPENLHFLEQDLFTCPSALTESFDLVVEHTLFCAIDPERREDYVQAVAGLLKPKGYFLGLFWTHSHPGGPPFRSTEEEVKALFSPAFNIVGTHSPTDSVASRQGEETLLLMRLR